LQSDSSDSIQRRLSAILAADIVGYSRLMSVDEVGTLGALKGHRRALIDPAIATHHGRIVKTTGDGALVEFASVVDAVACAVVIQRGMVARNAGIPEANRIVFRIGVNIGDIIVDGDDIFGDGVNIAARLESLCEPGGVCISRGERSDQGQANAGLCRSRGADGKKHLSRGRRFRSRLEGNRASAAD
jgi:class 3 adenylate cyclase